MRREVYFRKDFSVTLEELAAASGRAYAARRCCETGSEALAKLSLAPTGLE
jgi:hypothetical protein